MGSTIPSALDVELARYRAAWHDHSGVIPVPLFPLMEEHGWTVRTDGGLRNLAAVSILDSRTQTRVMLVNEHYPPEWKHTAAAVLLVQHLRCGDGVRELWSGFSCAWGIRDIRADGLPVARLLIPDEALDPRSTPDDLAAACAVPAALAVLRLLGAGPAYRTAALSGTLWREIR